MAVDNFLEGLGNLPGIQVRGQGPDHRQVVDSLMGGLHALEIEPGLLECHRNRAGSGRCGSRARTLLTGKQRRQDEVFYALESGGLDETIHVHRNAEFLVKVRGKTQGGQGREAAVDQWFGKGETVDAGRRLDKVGEFLLQDIQRCRLYGIFPLPGRLPGLRKGLAVYFLVDIQGYGINLHGHRGDHVRRFFLQYESIEGIDVHRQPCHDVGREEFPSSAFLVKGLYSGIGYSGELTDHAFNFLQFDTESPDLHLHVLPSDELDVAVGTIAHHISRPVDPPVGRIITERIVDEHLCSLVRPVKITVTDLETSEQKLAGGTDGQPLSAFAYDIGAYPWQRFPDRDVGLLLPDELADRVNRRLGGSVGIDDRIPGRSETGKFLPTGIKDLEGIVVREIHGELSRYLCRHQQMGDTVLREELVKGRQVQPDFIGDYVQGGSAGKGGGQVAHAGVEAETSVRRSMGPVTDSQRLGVVPCKCGNIAVSKAHPLRDTGRPAGVQKDEKVVGPGIGDFRPTPWKRWDLGCGEDGAVISGDQAFKTGIRYKQ